MATKKRSGHNQSGCRREWSSTPLFSWNSTKLPFSYLKPLIITRIRWGGLGDQTPLFIVITVSCGGPHFFYKNYSESRPQIQHPGPKSQCSQYKISLLSWGGAENGLPLFKIITVSCGGRPFFIRITVTAGNRTPTRGPRANASYIKYHYMSLVERNFIFNYRRSREFTLKFLTLWEVDIYRAQI